MVACMDKLEQRTFREKRVFLLLENGVAVVEKGTFRKREYLVSYETLDRNRFKITQSSKGWAWAAIVFLVLCLFVGITGLLEGEPGAIANMMFYGFFACICGALFAMSIQKFTGYATETGALLFYADKPSDGALKDFLAELERRRREYLFEHYSGSDESGSVGDELAKLHWLKEKGGLTDEEYEKLKRETIKRPDDDLSPPKTFFN